MKVVYFYNIESLIRARYCAGCEGYKVECKWKMALSLKEFVIPGRMVQKCYTVVW